MNMMHTAHNRGSVIWVKEYYHERMVRTEDPEDKSIGSEIIQLLLDTLPPTNILGVYQVTGIRNKVTKCKEKGQVCILMGDFNAPINDSAKPLKKAAVNILEWGKTREIRIVDNSKNLHTSHSKKAIDIVMITPGLLDSNIQNPNSR